MPGDEKTESRKYQECPYCDYICGTEQGLEMHKDLRHSEASPG